MMEHVICVDLGGTKAHVAHISKAGIGTVQRYDVPNDGTKSQVNNFIEQIIGSHYTSDCIGIAMGVPSSVRSKDGYVIETVNIPNWQGVPLQSMLSTKFNQSVRVLNDANCFTFGEYCYGPNLLTDNLVGVTLGTGLGSGIVLNGELYTGKNGSAGEFGSFPYLNGVIEDYTSGKFFKRLAKDGAAEAEKAKLGNKESTELFDQLGMHLGRALSQVLLAFDPDKIVLGGSVAQSFDLFSHSMFSTLEREAHPDLVSHIDIQPSRVKYAPLLGAYAIFNQGKTNFEGVI